MWLRCLPSQSDTKGRVIAHGYTVNLVVLLRPTIGFILGLRLCAVAYDRVALLPNIDKEIAYLVRLW